ncbi:MAG: site-2 protease family protein [Deltaproteobacteria bacterium]|nr:site-2 protease family protein [Deltaproteobacteria bacterium]
MAMEEHYEDSDLARRQGRLVGRHTRPKVILPATLFLATVVTTMTVGAFYEGANPLKNPLSLLKGIPFSAPLLFILGTHELGHFFASRRHGVASTLPFFIPAPPVPPFIGTFGAVIKMKSPITTRRALVDIGAAGPLAGFIAALIVLAWGIRLSTVIPRPSFGEEFGLGTPLVFDLLSYLIAGPVPDGYELSLHTVAFAGWIGLFVTSLNLLPIGQLDGGHIVYALFGAAHRWISLAVVAALVIFGIYSWPGWLVWAALSTIIGIRHPPVVDSNIPLGALRVVVSVLAMAVFILTFMPAPFYIRGL